MTITQIGSLASSAGTGNQTITLPVGWAQDDICLIGFSAGNGGGAITPPAGWTSCALQLTSGSRRLQVFYRILQSGDTNPTFTYTTSSIQAIGVVYRGVDLTNPFAATAVTSLGALGTGTFQGPGYAPLAIGLPNVRFVSFAACIQTASVPTINTANGFGSLGSAGTASGSPDASLAVATKEVTNANDAGVTEPVWNPGALSDRVTALIALRDATQRNIFRIAQDSSASLNMVGLLPSLTYGAETDGTTTPWTAAIPSEARDGDLLLAVVAGNAGGGTFSTPAGWTSVASVRDSTSRRLQIFSRRYVAGDANPSAAYSASSWTSCIICAKNAGDIDKLILDGQDQGNPNSSVFVTSDTPPTITDNNNKLGVALVISRFYSVNTLDLSVAQGYVEKKNIRNDQSVLIAEKQFRDDWVDIPSPTVALTSGTGSVCNIVLTIPGTLQPSRFRMAQDQSLETQAHTDFPEVLVGTVHKSSSGTAWSVPIPSYTRDGDLMILALVCGSGGTFTTPSGWTVRATIQEFSGRKLYLFSKVYAPGDVDPSGTYSSSGQDRMGVVLVAKYTAIADKIISYGSVQGNPASTVAATTHHAPDIPSINDTYSALISFFFVYNLQTNITGLTSGDEEGQTQVFRDFNADVSLLIAKRRWLGSGTAPGPSVQISAARTGCSAHVQLQGVFQPKEIAAAITQEQSVIALMSAEDGFPIEADIEQEQIVTLSVGSTKPKFSRHHRHLIWVHGLDGIRRGVID